MIDNLQPMPQQFTPGESEQMRDPPKIKPVPRWSTYSLKTQSILSNILPKDDLRTLKSSYVNPLDNSPDATNLKMVLQGQYAASKAAKMAAPSEAQRQALSDVVLGYKGQLDALNIGLPEALVKSLPPKAWSAFGLPGFAPPNGQDPNQPPNGSQNAMNSPNSTQPGATPQSAPANSSAQQSGNINQLPVSPITADRGSNIAANYRRLTNTPQGVVSNNSTGGKY